jgi:hypothetical protein
MDEISLLVEQTYQHLDQMMHFYPPSRSSSNGPSLFPDGPGIIYHIQKSTSIFVIRTFVSPSIKSDYVTILDRPEDYPSLRLTEIEEGELASKLKFFIVDTTDEAEMIHDQLHNRRFPIFEESICNLSDPGFSWWLTKKPDGFQISFTMSVANDEMTIKLGPLGDREIALKKFKSFEEIINSSGIQMNVQNEVNRVQFNECEEFIMEELKDLFEFGVVTETLKDIFKILNAKTNNKSELEEIWFYINELAAIRRFWIQIQFDL